MFNSDNLRLDGKCAIITGAGAGIGKEIAITFATAGASVVVSDINADAANHVVNEIQQLGGQAFACRCDITSEQELSALADFAVSKLGKVNILVNNAGGGGPKPFDMPMADFRRAYELNVLFWVPTDWSHSSKVVYAYLTYMGLGLCYSLVNIPYGSLATAMTQQPQSRARLGAARGIAASLTFVCLAFLIGPSIKNSSPEEMVSVYHFWTIVLAIAGMVLYFICFKSTRENVVRIVAQPSLKISLQTLKRNRPLFMLCIGALCVLISTFAVSASSLFYVRYVLNDTGLFTVLVLVQNLVGTVASAPLVPGMVARIGKKNTFLIGALLGTCGYLLFFWVSVWSLPVALVALAIASIGQGVTMTVMWALEADTVEYGEYLTGVRIEGLTYSLFSFTRKCGQAIGGSIPAFILGLSGYIANQAQTPEVIMGIRTSIALVPCGFMLLAFVIIWFYPLTDKKFKEIVVEIDNRKKVQQQLINDITS